MVGGIDIRDVFQGGFANGINGTTTIQVVSFANGTRRIDKQQFILPDEFRKETLLEIQLSDFGADQVQRVMLGGITAVLTPTSR